MPPLVVWRDQVIKAAIHAKILEAMEASAREIRREAVRLAPKRRVFRGQRRAQRRQLTKAELATEVSTRRKLGLVTGGKIFTTQEVRSTSVPSNPYLRSPGRRPITKFDVEDELGDNPFRQVHATQGRMRSTKAQAQLSSYGRRAVSTHPRISGPDYSGTVGDRAKILALKKSNSAMFQTPRGKWQLGGRLKGEIRYQMEQKPHKILGHIISPTYYARYVEFGTRHARAQPFMRPSLAKERRHMRKRIEGRLRNLGAPRR